MSGALTLLLPLAQPLGLLLLAPGFAGVEGWLRSRLAGLAAPSPLQPYRDLVKLLGKDELRPGQAGRLFDAAAVLALGATLAAAVLVPALVEAPLPGAGGGAVALVGLLALARVARLLGALDGGRGLVALAAGRERALAMLVEPTLLLALLAAALVTGSTELARVVSSTLSRPAAVDLLPRLLGLAALALATLADTGRDRAGDAADRGPLLEAAGAALVAEHGGPRLALLELGAELRRLLLAVLVVNLFFPWGVATTLGPLALLVAAAALAAKLGLFALGAATLEIEVGRLRLVRAGDMAGAAFVLAVLALSFAVLAAPGSGP
jgi:formate hydrogenlyase subunit 4